MDHMTLTNQTINDVREQIEAFLEKTGSSRQEIIRVTMSLEEIMLDYQAQLGESTHFTYRLHKHLGQPRIELTVYGQSLCPFPTEDDERFILNHLMADLGTVPTWQYRNGRNVITFMPLKRQRSTQAPVLISMVLALAAGLGFRQFAPELGVRLYTAVIAPVFEALMGVLSTISGPMIFFSIAWGIFSIGDTATLNRIGKRMIQRFITMSVISCLVTGVLALPFFTLSHGGSGGSLDLPALMEILLDIFPHNVVEPFVQNNPMQIIFIAVFVGLAMLIMGSKASLVATAVDQCNHIVLLLMDKVTVLIPFFIFASIFSMILSSDVEQLVITSRLVLFSIATSVLLIILPPLAVTVTHKVRPGLLVRKLLPAFLIAVSTASSAAAFSVNLETCEKRLGIDASITNFGVPLGQVIYMPAAASFYFGVSIFISDAYGVPVTPALLLNGLLISVLLSIAVPPIPGGDITAFSLLFLQLGIPVSALAVVLAIGMLIDYLGTAADLLCLQCEMVHLASYFGMLDEETLHREV